MAVCKQCGEKFSVFSAHTTSGICNECFFAREQKKAEQQQATSKEPLGEGGGILNTIGYVILALFGLVCIFLVAVAILILYLYYPEAD